MEAFSKLISTFSDENQKRGAQFEKLCKWFLENDPLYKAKLEDVWLWDDWPDRWGPDCGIDLVARDTEGNIWAIQAKCYNPEYSVSKKDVDSFLSESTNAKIHNRLLIATTDRIGANAVNVIKRQNETVPVNQLMLSGLLEAPIVWPKSIDELSTGRVIEKYTPKPYQSIAIDKIVPQLDKRGQLIMACGTGKTLTALWIAEELGSNTTLVLLPSLLLLSKTLTEWLTHCNEPFAYLPVCSDDTAASGADSICLSTSELAFPSTTDADEIVAFLDRKGRKVIFSTYQSTPKIVEAFKTKKIEPFDLIIADEAHRCAGKASSGYTLALDDSNIPAAKRLFMTATPKVFQAHFKKRAAESGVDVVSMDDKAVFGPVLHSLSFGEAIKQDLLTDYRVVVVGIDNPTYERMISERSLVETDNQIQSDAQSLASHIALAKAMQDYDLRRVISFHSRVNAASDFASNLPKVIEWMPLVSRPGGLVIANHVSGSMPTSQREQRLQALGNVKEDQRYVLTNARCLSEGVDVPTLDGVAFIDPKHSEIDIVQAVGRAIRLSHDKTIGTIVIPVFIRESEDTEEIFNSSPFKKVWAVVNALRSHDGFLGEQLDALRNKLGKRGTVGKPDKIIFDLPAKVTHAFERALKVKLLETTTASWEQWFGLLEDYKQQNGDCDVPDKYTTKTGLRLGSWVGVQRSKKDVLPEIYLRRLEELGFDWDPIGARWERGFEALKLYQRDNGNCDVHRSYVANDNFRLGVWVGEQRNKGTSVSKDRRARLDKLGFDWAPIYTQWEKGFAALYTYRKQNGDCLVSQTHITDEGFKLGTWVSNQRQRKHKLTHERLERLDALRFDWDPISNQWEIGFAALSSYKNKNGDCIVPKAYVTKCGFRLGGWIRRQRTVKNDLDEGYIAKLDSLGFVWDPTITQWETGFAELKQYRLLKGHCDISAAYVAESGFQLGSWVSKQRTNKDNLSEEFRARLDSQDFDWDPIGSAWEQGYLALKTFQYRNGNCLVPYSHVTEDGFKLGVWVRGQRARKSSLSKRRVFSLDEIGFDWDPRNMLWEKGFSALELYKLQKGHCVVPALYVADDEFKLGGWVVRQRINKGNLSVEQLTKLDSLGFVWDPHKNLWNRGFEALKRFHHENGNCLVTKNLVPQDGFDLVCWVQAQRKNKSSLSKARKEKLDSISFDWEPATSRWEQGFEALKVFYNQNGNCFVPQNMKTLAGFKIGTWVHTQRMRKTSLSSERRKKLEALDFDWNPLEDKWEQGFDALEVYDGLYGNCLVPVKYVDKDGFRLGSWVSRQRGNMADLSLERRERLNVLGFEWDPVAKRWDQGFESLKDFCRKNGNCLVAALYVTEDGFRLGKWVSRQRANKGNLSQERRSRLDELGFVWKVDQVKD